MAWSERTPLKAYLKHQRVVDVNLRRVLLAAANSAKRELVGISPSSLRAAQLRLQQEQLRMWAKLGTIIDDGISGNAPIVANINSIYTDDLLKGIGVKSNAAFRHSMSAQARNTIRVYLAREQLGMNLSERVYRNGLVANGRIDNVVDKAILRGASAREIARDVAGLINPNTPGGVSYAAMRLGRTELNNSFHEAAKQTMVANPFVDKAIWSLSGSHPRADDCDDLVGTYRVDDVPDKPHPQCLCYIMAKTISDRELVRRFKTGEFDQWADSQMSA